MEISDEDLMAHGYEPKVIWAGDEPKTLWVKPPEVIECENHTHRIINVPLGQRFTIKLENGVPTEVILYDND